MVRAKNYETMPKFVSYALEYCGFFLGDAVYMCCLLEPKY